MCLMRKSIIMIIYVSFFGFSPKLYYTEEIDYYPSRYYNNHVINYKIK